MLLLYCLITLCLALAAIAICRRHQQKCRHQRDHRRSTNRRLKKAANGTTLSGSFSMGTAELAAIRRHHQRDKQQQQQQHHSDPACNPLVPKQIAGMF
jgi:hypothetical protein